MHCYKKAETTSWICGDSTFVSHPESLCAPALQQLDAVYSVVCKRCLFATDKLSCYKLNSLVDRWENLYYLPGTRQCSLPLFVALLLFVIVLILNYCAQTTLVGYLQTVSNGEYWQEAQLPLRNRASAMYFFVTFYRRNDLQLRIITPEAYVRWNG